MTDANLMSPANLDYDDIDPHTMIIQSLKHQQLGITDAVTSLVVVYAGLYKTDAYHINCGLCEDFAIDLIVVMGGDPYRGSDDIWMAWHDEMPDCTEDEATWHAHCFVVYQGRYYDSEAPEGVNHWRDLPCIKNCPVSSDVRIS